MTCIDLSLVWSKIVIWFELMIRFVNQVVLETMHILGPAYKESIYLLVLGILIFLLRKHFAPWLPQRAIEPEGGVSLDTIKKPKIELSLRLNKSVYFVQFPLSLLLTACLTLGFIEFLNIILILGLDWPSENVGLLANRIAVATAAVSILFPVALLIIDNEWGDNLGSVSKSQTLLSYSHALPMGVSLLAGVGRFSFPLHPYAGGVVAVWSIMVAAWVFYRLVRVVLFPTLRKGAEEQVIKDQVFRSMIRSAEERVGFSNTKRAFDRSKEGEIEFTPYRFRDEKYEALLDVTAEQAGVLDEIDAKELISLFNKVLSFLSDIAGTAGASNGAEEEKQSPILKMEIRVHVGQELSPGRQLAELYVRKNVDGQKRRVINLSKYRTLFRHCFKFSRAVDQGLILEQFKEFCNELRFKVLRFAKEGNLEELTKIERYLGAWLDAQADAFDVFKIKYDATKSESELTNSLFSPSSEWKPIRETLEIIGESARTSLKLDKSDNPEFVKKVTDMVDSLFIKMAKRKEMLSCTQLLWENLRIWVTCTRQNKVAGAWISKSIFSSLESFFRYYVVSLAKDETEETEERSQAIEFTEAIYSIAQEYLRWSLISTDIEQYRSFLNFVERNPEFFKYDDVEHRIEMLEIYQRHNKLDSSSAEQLEKLRSEMKLIKQVEEWRDEICVGQGTLVIMMMAGEARDDRKTLGLEKATEFIKLLLHRMPTNITDALRLLYKISKRGADDFWRWKQWEHIPTIDEGSGAKFMMFNLFLDRYLSLNLIKAASEDADEFEFDESLLDRDLQYKLSLGDNCIQKKLDENIKLAQELKIIPEGETAELKERLNKFIDAYVKKTEDQRKQKLVITKLDPEIISQIPKEFDDSFIDASRLRPWIRVIKKGEGKRKCIKERMGG